MFCVHIANCIILCVNPSVMHDADMKTEVEKLVLEMDQGTMVTVAMVTISLYMFSPQTITVPLAWTSSHTT